MDHLRDAESKITKILKEYEAVSGNLVTSVSINAIDVTRMCDDRPIHRMAVQIEIFRPPAHGWVE